MMKKLRAFIPVRRACKDTQPYANHVHIRPRHLHVTHNLLGAVHSLIEEIKTPDEASWQEAHILATNVYLKTPQGWRIVLHHASVAPGKPPDEQRVGSAILH